MSSCNEEMNRKTLSMDEPCLERLAEDDEDEIDSDIGQIVSLFSGLKNKCLKKVEKEFKEEIKELKQLSAEKDKKLKQQSDELQMLKQMNKALILETERLKSSIEEKKVTESKLMQQIKNPQIRAEEYNQIRFTGLAFHTLESLVRPVLENEAIKALNLQASPLKNFAHCFACLMTNNFTLTSLYLTHGTIDDEGVNKLAHSLKGNKTLILLSLNSNPGITSASCQELVKLLHVNKTLRFLSVSHTDINMVGARLLVNSLETNTTLEHLVLDERHRVSFSDEKRLKF
uniref:Uncharacterized protein n=1 Tax=Amphimedon queenslandica TaxID=400682 RepID=A0A1X7T0V0_AMPQE